MANEEQQRAAEEYDDSFENEIERQHAEDEEHYDTYGSEQEDYSYLTHWTQERLEAARRERVFREIEI